MNENVNAKTAKSGSLLSRFRIQSRLTVYAITLFVLIALLTLSAVVVLDRIRGQVSGLTVASVASEAATATRAEALALDAMVARFVGTGDVGLIPAIQLEQDRLRAAITALQRALGSQGSASVGPLEAQAEAMLSATDRLVAARQGINTAYTDQIEPLLSTISAALLDLPAGGVGGDGVEQSISSAAGLWTLTLPLIEEASKTGDSIALEGAHEGLDLMEAPVERVAGLPGGLGERGTVALETLTALSDIFDGLEDRFEAVHTIQDTEIENAVEGLIGAATTLRDRLSAEKIARDSEANSVALTGEWTVGIIGVVCLFVMVVAAFVITVSITRPINALSHAMEALSAGKLTVPVPHIHDGDEVGAMARASDAFKSMAVTAVRAERGLEAASVGMMLADVDGQIIMVNPALVGMVRDVIGDAGADGRGLIGRSISLFQADGLSDLPDIRAGAVAEVRDVALSDKRYQVAISPMIGSEGEALGRVLQWDDLTNERAIETEIEAVIAKAVTGDFSARLSVSNKPGFQRVVAEGVNRLSTSISAVTEDLAKMLGHMAGGDLSARMSDGYSGLFQQVANDFNATGETLDGLVGQIREVGQILTQASAEVAAGSADLAERTETQAANLEEAAAAMEQMVATVRSNATNAQQASEVVTRASGSAEEGGQVARDAAEAITRIEESSRRITDIIGVIDDIAFQTNLLALNAAVEAARAGEAGRGFAVVAQEVRTLAQRSAQSSREIKDLINASNVEVQTGVEQVMRAREALDGIQSTVNEAASLMTEIAQASAEQANALDDVNATVSQMDESTQKNAALVEESTAAAQSLQTQSETLTKLLDFFQVHGSAAGGASTPNRGVPTPKKATAPSTPPLATPSAAPRDPIARVTAPAAPKQPTSGPKTRIPAPAPPPRPVTTESDGDWRSMIDTVSQDKRAMGQTAAPPPAAARPATIVSPGGASEDADWEEF